MVSTTAVVLLLHFAANTMVDQLGSRSYRAREQAEHAISDIGAAINILPELDRGLRSRDLETVRRCQKLRDLACRRMVAGLGRLPWIDTLPDAWPERAAVICHFLDQRFSYQTQSDGPDLWPSFRAATAPFLCDLVARGWTWKQVTGLVAVMRANEAYACERYRKTHQWLWSNYPVTPL